MRKTLLTLALASLVAGLLGGCAWRTQVGFGSGAQGILPSTGPDAAVADAETPPAATAPAKGHRLLASWAPGTDAFFYQSDTSGTYTVPSGAYVTSWSAHSTSGATVAITPSGPNIVDAQAGTNITIPAGSAYNMSKPALAGNANELGAGTVFVFTGTDAYVITMYLLGGP
jgi:hypothetical protein